MIVNRGLGGAFALKERKMETILSCEHYDLYASSDIMSAKSWKI
jgi:hypothetical protein